METLRRVAPHVTLSSRRSNLVRRSNNHGGSAGTVREMGDGAVGRRCSGCLRGRLWAPVRSRIRVAAAGPDYSASPFVIQLDRSVGGGVSRYRVITPGSQSGLPKRSPYRSARAVTWSRSAAPELTISASSRKNCSKPAGLMISIILAGTGPAFHMACMCTDERTDREGMLDDGQRTAGVGAP